MSAKTVFIHGRPGPHPIHALFASAIGAIFVPVDFLIRWHDLPASRIRKYLSWVLCSLLFPRIRTYQVVLVDSVHFLPLIMRRIGRLRKDQKVAAILSDETAVCLKANRYSRLTGRALTWALRNYDALICLGNMQTNLVESLLEGNGGPKVFTARGGGVLRDRSEVLSRVRPALDQRTVLFTGHGPNESRGWYKGVDVLLHAVGLASDRIPGLRLRIIGEWDRAYIRSIEACFSRRFSGVEFLGNVWDLSLYSHHLSRASLYVHLGRGDAFPISVLEAMCAGLPCVVSEGTGTREVVERVDPRLVVQVDAESAAERLQWYFSLSLDERMSISNRGRKVAAEYTEERAVESFLEAYRRMLRHFDLPDLPQEAVGDNRWADRSQWWPRQA